MVGDIDFNIDNLTGLDGFRNFVGDDESVLPVLPKLCEIKA